MYEWADEFIWTPASPSMTFFGRGNAEHYLVVTKLEFFERVPKLTALFGFNGFYKGLLIWSL